MEETHALAPDLEPRPIRNATGAARKDQEYHHEPGEEAGARQVCSVDRRPSVVLHVRREGRGRKERERTRTKRVNPPLDPTGRSRFRLDQLARRLDPRLRRSKRGRRLSSREGRRGERSSGGVLRLFRVVLRHRHRRLLLRVLRSGVVGFRIFLDELGSELVLVEFVDRTLESDAAF